MAVDQEDRYKVEQEVDNLVVEVVVVLVPMPVLARYILEVVEVEHIPGEELDRGQARVMHIQQLVVEGTGIPVELEVGSLEAWARRDELEQLERRIRNSHMGSLRPVVVVRPELVVGVERYIQLVEVDLGLLNLVTIHQQEINIAY